MSEFDNINFDATSRIMVDETTNRNAKVKVFGVGGAGGNTVNRMKQMNIEGVEYYAVNTDGMALDLSLADHKILIGEKTTKGLGAGMNPEVARKAVEENVEELKESMKGADIIFVTAGMGGGTGTGAAPIVANIAREMGILTVAVVTKPFRWEGNARNNVAVEGIKNLRAAVDTIIIIENKKLLSLIQATCKNATVDESFKIVDEILGNAVQSICNIMFHHGLVHVDFADIRKVMLNGGNALMGTGFGQGEGRGIVAADMALASPLLEDIDIEGASGVLVNVSHGENYSLLEHDEAMGHIYDIVGEAGNPNIIVGDITLPELGDKVCITIIATGCGGSTPAPAVKPAPMFADAFSQIGASAQQYAAPVQQTVAQPRVAPVQPQMAQPATAVQQATPRSTAMNFVTMAGARTEAPAAASQEMFTRRVMPVNAPEMPTVQSGAYTSANFNAMAPAEESSFRNSDTSEFSAVADEDRFNGGNGGFETPAYLRQTVATAADPRVSRAAVAERQDSFEDGLKDGGIDYSLPAYLRNQSNMENF